MTIAQDIEKTRCELAEWQAAYDAARTGASYTIDGVSLTRQDIERTIIPQRRRLHRALRQLEAAANGAKSPSVRVAVLRSEGM